MTPPKDQAPWLVARVKRALDRKPDATRCDLTRETVEGLIHAYEQLEAENAELRGKLEKVEAREIVRGVWGRCEAMENEAYAKLEKRDGMDEHEVGFWRGQKLAAKSIRRSTEMPPLTEQANIRSPVQSRIREPYEGEDGA
ncbi:hypothetical protein [Falsirhodobacter xinxiangensis]|uniref:hypothetical protein n=1 Tax=Falsirhodobacter xinxiangensis TaxID=2530049 RepID=UPI0010AB4BAD|nr:hypothetical protein [Rhodobacter xinxiangensis]